MDHWGCPSPNAQRNFFRPSASASAPKPTDRKEAACGIGVHLCLAKALGPAGDIAYVNCQSRRTKRFLAPLEFDRLQTQLAGSKEFSPDFEIPAWVCMPCVPSCNSGPQPLPSTPSSRPPWAPAPGLVACAYHCGLPVPWWSMFHFRLQCAGPREAPRSESTAERWVEVRPHRSWARKQGQNVRCWIHNFWDHVVFLQWFALPKT